MTEQSTPSNHGTPVSTEAAGGTAVVGPLTIRDLAVLGSVAIIFIASLIPLIVTPAGSINLWNTTSLFYMAIGMVLPLATGALFLIRRFSPDTKLRLGSLSLDQFASIVAVFAAFFYFTGTVTNFQVTYLVGLIGSVVFMLATTCAPWIPVLAADFAGRAETPAHVVARDAVAPAKRVAAPKPVINHAAGAATAGGAANAYAAAAAAPADSAPGEAAAPSGWAATRPATGHTSGGQIFTPAKDEVTAKAAGASVSAAAASSAVTADAADKTSTTSPAPSSTEGDAQEADAEQTAVRAAVAEVPTGSVQEPATTVNPQLSESVKTPSASDSTVPGSNSTAPAAAAASAVAASTVQPTPVKESIAATVDPKAAAPAVIAEPFWFAVDRPQNVIDEKTRQFIYKLTPGSWILALEDRGTSFLVQDSHGKTGVLLDLVGIERAADSQ